jgi:GxxExxY protein
MRPERSAFEGAEAPLTYDIIGSALEVLNEFGHGFHEKPYENALLVELRLRSHACEQQHRFAICYKRVEVGEYVPDLIVGGRVVVDAKVIERITDHERGRMLNYLRITKLRVGLILNFRHAKLEWERVVL